MSEKIYGICENKCLKEVYPKEETYNKTEVDTKLNSKANSSDLVNYKLKGDFAVINCVLTLSNGTADTIINYPSGFNSDNCIVIAFLARNSLLESGIKHTYGYIETPTGYASGAIGHRVTLTSNDIRLEINNPQEHTSGTSTYDIKIVLMKV